MNQQKTSEIGSRPGRLSNLKTRLGILGELLDLLPQVQGDKELSLSEKEQLAVAWRQH